MIHFYVDKVSVFLFCAEILRSLLFAAYYIVVPLNKTQRRNFVLLIDKNFKIIFKNSKGSIPKRWKFNRICFNMTWKLRRTNVYKTCIWREIKYMNGLRKSWIWHLTTSKSLLSTCKVCKNVLQRILARKMPMFGFQNEKVSSAGRKIPFSPLVVLVMVGAGVPKFFFDILNNFAIHHFSIRRHSMRRGNSKGEHRLADNTSTI